MEWMVEVDEGRGTTDSGGYICVEWVYQRHDEVQNPSLTMCWIRSCEFDDLNGSIKLS